MGMTDEEINGLDTIILQEYMSLSQHLKDGGYYLTIKRHGVPVEYTLHVFPTASRWERIRAWWQLLKSAL